VTECQGCGAWNDTSRTLCVLCGTPLAEIDEWDAAAELPPLPPLPDGGLHASMPSWLREPPAPIIAGAPPLAPADHDDAAEQVADLAALGSRADPRTFLGDDDFPQWLRDLAVRQEWAARRPAESVSAGAPAGMVPPAGTHQPVPELDSAPGTELRPESEAGSDEPAPAAAVAAFSSEGRRGRDIGETLLLVILFVGVVAAAVWALVANGVLSVGQ
jgi:hypothetical protein